ncbi:MAG: ATP-grasp domain-containing protein [Candidatus Saccharimonadales bacterium]
MPNYKIASLHGWDTTAPDMPPVYALEDQVSKLPELKAQNTQSFIRTKDFQVMLDQFVPGYDVLTYKPVVIPDALSDRRFLMVDPRFTEEYENKVIFREKFKSSVNFPNFTIYEREELLDSPEFYDEFMSKRAKVVVQDEQLSGGKGTFFVASHRQYQKMLADLSRLSAHRKVVVSDAVPGARERSIQACVTDDKVYVGPLQRQIVGNPLLSNIRIADGDKFCGATIIKKDQATDLHRQAIAVAEKVGQVLQADGYRGIFGIDYLLSDSGELYVIEVNPRITGVTPLLTALDSDNHGIPFYLLHILELGRYPYKVVNSDYSFDREGSWLVLHCLSDQIQLVTSLPVSGTYEVGNGRLKHISDNQTLLALEAGQFILQNHLHKGSQVKPGGRTMSLQFGQPALDYTTDELYNSVVDMVTAVQAEIITQTI